MTDVTFTVTPLRAVQFQTVAIPGPSGPGGGTGGGTMAFPRPSAAAVWTLNHNTSSYPSVTVVDGSGEAVMADIAYPSSNTVTVTFGAPTSGTAYLN